MASLSSATFDIWEEKIGVALQGVAGWIMMKPSKSRQDIEQQLACISCQPRITAAMKKPKDTDLLMIFFSFFATASDH